MDDMVKIKPARNASQRTKNIRLGHGIVQLTTNHPARVAERIATLDLLSHGRVEFGIGEGSSVTELHPFDRRFRDKRAVWEAAVRAFRIVGRGTPRDLSVVIDKRIPLEAGLGGGSTDAAAMLRALAALWPDELSVAICHRVASKIGADVPFFLLGGTALGLGAGDELFPLIDLPKYWAVLLIPDFGVSTAAAYGWFDVAPRRIRPVESREPLAPRAADLSRVVKLVNELEPAVLAKYPEIRRMKTALRRAGATRPSMSGSGSCVFGLFSRRRDAAAAAAALRRREWRVIMTRTVTRGDVT